MEQTVTCQGSNWAEEVESFLLTCPDIAFKKRRDWVQRLVGGATFTISGPGEVMAAIASRLKEIESDFVSREAW